MYDCGLYPLPSLYLIHIHRGNVAVDQKKTVFCIDDTVQGIGLYELDTVARLRSFPIPMTKTVRPRQLAFAENARVIVGGSDHGAVYVFDRRSGEVLDVLNQGTEWTQTVTVRRLPKMIVLIASDDSVSRR